MNTKNKPPTIINFILDRSGSMDTIRKSVISGFNEYINGIKTAKGSKNTLFTLTTFDTMGIETPYLATPVNKIKPLTDKNYIPRAGTPLYDVVVKTIESLAEKVEKEQPVLVVIMTDGEENSSTEHNAECFKDLVEKLKMKGNWTFVFMGANQDSWLNASSWGLSVGNTQDWSSTEKGTSSAFRGLAQASAMYMASVGDTTNNVKSVDNFFNQNVSQSSKSLS